MTVIVVNSTGIAADKTATLRPRMVSRDKFIPFDGGVFVTTGHVVHSQDMIRVFNGEKPIHPEFGDNDLASMVIRYTFAKSKNEEPVIEYLEYLKKKKKVVAIPSQNMFHSYGSGKFMADLIIAKGGSMLDAIRYASKFSLGVGHGAVIYSATGERKEYSW